MTEHKDTFKSKPSDANYRENHKRIFGNVSVKSGSYHYDKENDCIVEGREFVEDGEVRKTPYFIPALNEAQSPITGEMISCRRKLRNHCKEHGVYLIGESDARIKTNE